MAVPMKTPNSNRIGVLVLALALASLAQLLFVSYSMRQSVECQSRVNEAFLSTLKSRAQIGDGDRDAVRMLVSDLVAAKTEKQSQEAIADYNEQNQKLDALRGSFEYPDIGSCG